MSRVITPLPYNKFFEGSAEEFLDEIKGFFDTFRAYVTKWNRIFHPFALDIYSRNTGEEFDMSWKDDLIHMFTDKEFHDKIFANKDVSEIQSNSLREFFSESYSLFLHRDLTPRKEIDVMIMPSLQGMATYGKSQEVITLSYAIDNLLQHCYNLDQTMFKGVAFHDQLHKLLSYSQPISPKSELKRENLTFIDVGAGKGYFSVFMAAEVRIRTLTIEASLSHACHMKNRIGCLISQKKVDPSKFDLLELCIGYMTKKTNVEGIHQNSMKYAQYMETVHQLEQQQKSTKKKKPKKIVTEPVPDDQIPNITELKYSEQQNKPRVIQGELAVEIGSIDSLDLDSREYITIGLHACGDLSIVTHEIALHSPKARGAISVPCCYQHLSPIHLPLLSENQDICDLLFGNDEAHRHNLLNFALYEYDVPMSVHELALSQFMSRAIIDCFIPPRKSIKKTPQKKDETFEAYIKRLANSYDLFPTDEEIAERIQHCKNDEWKMMAHTVIRELFGHVFESFLLLERLTFFTKMCIARPEDYLIGMFDVFSHLSPRGFSLFTLKL